MAASSHPGGFSTAERSALCDLLDALGPDAATLCAGWNTRDMAAHLVTREARADAALGVNGGPTAAWTERVRRDALTIPYAELVRRVRTGPPAFSFFRIPGIDGLFNLTEYTVHHEDVRRAQPNWQPRDVSPEFNDALWRHVRRPAAGVFGRARCGITLERTDARWAPPQEQRTVVRPSGGSEPTVTISGPTLDILMLAFGRTAVEVDVAGDEAAVKALRTAGLIPGHPL